MCLRCRCAEHVRASSSAYVCAPATTGQSKRQCAVVLLLALVHGRGRKHGAQFNVPGVCHLSYRAIFQDGEGGNDVDEPLGYLDISAGAPNSADAPRSAVDDGSYATLDTTAPRVDASYSTVEPTAGTPEPVRRNVKNEPRDTAHAAPEAGAAKESMAVDGQANLYDEMASAGAGASRSRSTPAPSITLVHTYAEFGQESSTDDLAPAPGNVV